MCTEFVEVLERVMQGTAETVNIELGELCMHVGHLIYDCKGGEKVGVMNGVCNGKAVGLAN
jgi:hypothetical protein